MDKLIQRIVRKHNTNCPFTIAQQIGITVMFEDLGKNTNGFFHRRLRRNYIVLHYDLSYQQQRATCAHELGHYFYDRGASYFLMERNTLFLPDKFERRANQFSAKLLCAKSEIEPGETISEFCYRNGLPEYLHKYYEIPKI